MGLRLEIQISTVLESLLRPLKILCSLSKEGQTEKTGKFESTFIGVFESSFRLTGVPPYGTRFSTFCVAEW